MTHVAVVGCGARKRDGTHPARDLYTGPLFTAARADVEARGVPWLILSALYGLVSPDKEIATYDRRISETKREEACVGCGARACLTARGWCYRRGFIGGLDARLRQVMARHGRPLTVEVHAGAEYVDVLLATLVVQEQHIRLTEPCRGLSVGRRIGWYAARRRAGHGRQLSLFGAVPLVPWNAP